MGLSLRYLGELGSLWSVRTPAPCHIGGVWSVTSMTGNDKRM